GELSRQPALFTGGRNVSDTKFFFLNGYFMFQDQEQSTPLHAAAYLGDVHVMELLINAGANVNSKDQGLLTPLHRAAASRNERAVGLLLKHKAEINARDKFWHTPLHMAAANWATSCAAALIPHVCSLDVTDKLGRTPLHHAAHSGHAEMVNLFLRKGASANAKDKKERQPIHWAAHLGHLDVLKLLVSHIAEVMCKDKHGYTPLHVAAASGHVDVVRCLLRLRVEVKVALPIWVSCNVKQIKVYFIFCIFHTVKSVELEFSLKMLEKVFNVTFPVNKEGKSPLHMAAMQGRFTSSQILIQNGGEIDCLDVNGNTPLHIAARYGQELLTSTLLTNGAARGRQGIHGMLPLHFAALFGFPDCCRKLLSNDDYGRTCLHAAASGGNVECLNLLINNGAELDIKDDLGRSPLHYAAANGNSQCTISLVRAGAEVNEADLTGCSPLHYAAASHTFSGCLDFLLDNGANPTLKNSMGYSAVHYAAAYGNKQHLELVSHEVESNIPVSPLHLAAYYGHCEALYLLCETLVSLDVRDIDGQTALHLAAKRGFSKCVEVLLEHQASYTLKDYKQKRTALHAAGTSRLEQSAAVIDCQDAQGQTALILAALGRHTDCVHILLEKNANPDAADKQGFTALHRAAMLGSEESALALLEHGASALCRDSQGKTPLHLAASCGHTKLLHMLLKAAKKADPLDSMLDFRGFTPTHWAAYHGHEGCLHILLEDRLYSNQEGNPFTPLHCALINGHDAAAGLLVKTVGPHIVHTIDTKGRTPLHAAAYSGSVAGLELVLAHGAQVNAVDPFGCSAVMVAADCGQTMAVEFLLLKAKPDLTLVDVNNNTALHLACSKGHEMCALLILGEIADPSLINARNNSLQMPLHIAARKGLATVVQVLLSRGAAVMAVDEDGHTPALACAPNKNVADCLALILSTMRPFPPREADADPASHFSPILKNCSIAATLSCLPSFHVNFCSFLCPSSGLSLCVFSILVSPSFFSFFPSCHFFWVLLI
uniref:Ankyrin repeat domain 52 n=1 Tax=Fundulus heteroclitus TaxID=8078 RepID=A0A3Q2QDF2_FUNHE